MGAIFTNIAEIFANSGWAQIFFAEGGWKYAVMIGVACVLLYLAIVHQFEPLLLLPIGRSYWCDHEQHDSGYL